MTKKVTTDNIIISSNFSKATLIDISKPHNSFGSTSHPGHGKLLTIKCFSRSEISIPYDLEKESKRIENLDFNTGRPLHKSSND